MNIDNISVYNIKNAMRGMRNPLESWDRNDSDDLTIGEKDLVLAQRLLKAGPEHSKFMRQIFVSMNITAPIFWWKEADTYKVGTTANSCSTMHKLTSTPITDKCFEFSPPIDEFTLTFRNALLRHLEGLRVSYNDTKDIKYWRELVELLPQGWLQKRTWSGNFAVLRNIYNQRKDHKLKEWHYFCDTILNEVPYGKELIAY